MTTHHPMCSPESLYPDDVEDQFCHCELAALILADERARAEKAMNALELHVCVDNGSAQPHLDYWQVRKAITGKERGEE